LLDLPDHVFPVAGLALGWPAATAEISQRLPLALTLHENRFGSGDPRPAVEAYDRARAVVQPYAKQRFPDDYGEAPDYGWSEDKARQYSKPERAHFGAFVRAKGFKLD
jgi:nitroreductase/FMN reductase [NAD(P)H]